MNNKVWICSKCKRVYPHSLKFCPKCNISKNHATRLINKFINNENKVTTIKSNNAQIKDNRKNIEKRYKT